MARIQILELPEGVSDERPPFALIVDEFMLQRYIPAGGQGPRSPFEGVAEQVGARAVLVFQETIEIPANEIPVGSDGYPLTIKVEGDFGDFRQQIEDEVKAAQDRLRQARSM